MRHRRIIRGTAAVILLVLATACQPAQPALVEDFDGTFLDESVWHANRWFAAECAAGATGGEQQWHRPHAAQVSGGRLVLTAEREDNHCAEGNWGGTRPYSTGWVQTGGSRTHQGTTEPGYLFTYGRVDVRFRASAAQGLWPAIWLLAPGERREDGALPYPSRPEIDIVEIYGDEPSRWKFHLHSTDAGEDVDPGHAVTGPDVSTGFHTASVDWRADKITWLIDDQPMWTYTGPGIPSEPMYLIMSLAVGSYAGEPDPSAFPAEMVVDSVRITP